MHTSNRKMTRRHDRAFCVVQFIELPFESIDDYVCVPNTWVIIRRDQKASVAYPKDEDPFDTRDRAKRSERYDDEWRYYMAAVKYESATYRDAEYWIATRNDYGPLVEEESEITHAQARFTLDKELRNANRSHSSKANDNLWNPLSRIKRSALSEPKKLLDWKRLKLNEAAQSSSAVVNEANAEPGCSKRQQLIIIQDKKSMESALTQATSFASNGESSSSQHTVTAPSIPSTDVDTPTVAIDDDKEVQSTNNMEQQLSSNQVIAKFMKMLQPVQGPQISVAPSMEVTCNDQEHCTHEVLRNEPSSRHSLNSLKMSGHLYSNMNRARRLVPIGKPVEKRLRPMNISRNLAIAAQNSSNSMDQTGSLSTRSMKEKPLMVTQNQSQGGQRVLEINTGNNTHQIASRRSIAISPEEIQNVPKINVKRSHDMAAVDRSNVLHSSSNITSASQSLSSSSQGPIFIRKLDGQQNSPTQEHYLTRSHQNQYLPTDENAFEGDLLRGSTESDNDDHQLNSGTIRIRIPSIRPNSTNPSKPLYQTSEIPQQRQSQPNQQDSQRQRQRPKIRIGISIKPKNNRQRSTLQGVTKKTPPSILKKVLNSVRQALSSTHNSYLLNEQQLQASRSESVLVNESHLNVRDNSCQTDGCIVEDPLSPYHAINADRPTAAQNSTSTNHETFPRVVLEQQMLDNFATLFTQMGTTLRYTCDMYNNLRSSILETAETYKKLLHAIERFNTAGSLASNASSFE